MEAGKLIVWLTIEIEEENEADNKYGYDERVQFIQLLDGQRAKLLFDTVEEAYEFCEEFGFDEDEVDVDTN